MGWLNDRLRALRGLPLQDGQSEAGEPQDPATGDAASAKLPGTEELPLLSNRFPSEMVGDTRRAVHNCPLLTNHKRPRELRLHMEHPDKASQAWQALLRLIEEAVQDGREEFAPGREMDGALWHQITVLPPEIGALTKVRRLLLYGSSLLRIPPEIGQMQSLEVFEPYTSYGLHWFPYEITLCRHLRESTVSTRALYGNYKYRPSFPRLNRADDIAALAPTHCSVCGASLTPATVKQVWISLRVATDVLPLLVNACSQACIDSLPPGHENYIRTPHTGGLEQQQPGHSPYHM